MCRCGICESYCDYAMDHNIARLHCCILICWQCFLVLQYPVNTVWSTERKMDVGQMRISNVYKNCSTVEV